MKRHYGYDADSTLSLVQTSTGIWTVTYNAQNRAVKFESADGSAIITCAYDYMGRRFKKQVVSNGTITTHQRFIYRGYLQVAAVNLKEDAPTPDLWFLIWDPTQSVATRPLALRKDGVWYTYGWDLTKNICELYGQEGYIRTIYRYTPYGTVTTEGDVEQAIQWSSEYHVTELGLVYYNYRYYNPQDGRWTRRDPIGIEGGVHLYGYAENKASYLTDVNGKDIVANFFVGERGHTPFHAAVSVDNWTCKNGNWEKAGVVEYGLQPLFIIDDTFTFSWSLVNLLSSLGLGGYGFINREELKDHPSDWNTWRVSLSREDDMQIINELNSASSSSGTYYHVALRNCQLWVTAVMLKALIKK